MMRRSKLIITGIVCLLICVLTFLTAREKFVAPVSKKAGRAQTRVVAAQTETSTNPRTVPPTTTAVEKKQRAVKPRVKIAKDLKTATLK